MSAMKRTNSLGWMLLAALATLALGAVEASAYDLSAGSTHTCALDDNGVTLALQKTVAPLGL